MTKSATNRNRGQITMAATVALLLSAWLARADELRIGAAETVITPPNGIPLAGYYHERGADGVLDELQAKTIVIAQGGEKVALVALDLISTTRSLVEQARAEVEKTAGIKGANVMLSATHAHTGPELTHRGRRSDALGGNSPLAVEFSERLPGMIASCVKVAEERLAPARLSAAIGREEHLSFNRRYYLRDGSVGWNPGKLNTNIVAPAGRIDPDVGVLYAETLTNQNRFGKPIVTYVNFAMHPDTTGGNKYSADYPGALSRILAGYRGTNMVTLFANGACGNLNHVDVNWSVLQSSAEEAHRIGVILGAAVLQAYRQLKPIAPGPLRVKTEMVKLPLPEVTRELIEQARRDVATESDKTRDGFMKLVNGFKVLDVAARDGKPQEVEVQVIALGSDVAWVSLPGEMFVELGLAIKKHSPFPYTMIAELANGAIGYIPDRRSYAEGNYEPVSSRCAPGSGELLVQAALRLLNDLHDESK